MAFQNEGWSTTVEIYSFQNHNRNVVLHWDATVTDETEAQSAYAAWATDYAAVGSGVIKAYEHRVRSVDDAFALPNDDDGARDGNEAVIVTGIDGLPDKTANIFLPFPKQAVFVSPTGKQANTVDPTDTDLQAYVANFTTAQKAMISDGEKSAGNILSGKRKGS